jgi:hypothetical protein
MKQTRNTNTIVPEQINEPVVQESIVAPQPEPQLKIRKPKKLLSHKKKLVLIEEPIPVSIPVSMPPPNPEVVNQAEENEPINNIEINNNPNV